MYLAGAVGNVERVDMVLTVPMPRRSRRTQAPRLPVAVGILLLVVNPVIVQAQTPAELFCNNYVPVCRQRNLGSTPEDCRAALAGIADGTPGATSGDTVACRYNAHSARCPLNALIIAMTKPRPFIADRGPLCA